ncbi:MAG: hypothetical protein AB8G95_29170 [Anaerolineae bacterium]
MSQFSHFILNRLSDEVVYHFDRMPHPNGQTAYKRRDKDLWIVFRPYLGWVAWDDENQLVQGRPWNVAPQAQGDDHPPEGEWVSKKGVKSYVYELKFIPVSPQS